MQPKATLTYKVSSDKLVYATYSTGFRSGGFNAPTVSIPVYRAENLDNFEAGFKTSWMNRKLVLNGAIYKANSKDFQFFFIDAATASQIIGNIDKVSIWGLELEAQAMLAKGFQIYGGLGTTDSQIKRNTRLPSTVGNKTPKSTNWTLNTGFQYKTPISDQLGFLARVDYQHRGKKYWQVDNRDVQAPVDLVDIRVGLENERWGLYVSGRNILGEKYYADFNPTAFSGLDTAIGFRGHPATWAISGKLVF